MSEITIYDTETTGLSTKTDYILELAAITYDTELRQPVNIYSSLVLWPSRPEIPHEASNIHHITQEMLDKHAKPFDEVAGHVLRMSENSEFMAGHNVIDYDSKIFESNLCRLHDGDHLIQKYYGLKYLDTMIDLPYPERIKTRTLTYLAFEHGYMVKDAHRALPDVQACMHLISCYDYGLIREIASTEIVNIEAKVSFSQKDLAKTQGFKWNGETKQWIKSIREYWYNDQLKQFRFDTEIMNTSPKQQGELPF